SCAHEACAWTTKERSGLSVLFICEATNLVWVLFFYEAIRDKYLMDGVRLRGRGNPWYNQCMTENQSAFKGRASC
ncbi:MAG: hypothetical protein LBG50_04605, partial [Clostridiales Family XIII bacterium]|nr:hypothetical protein [Clostridiales Family XIII bacterium]